MRLVRNNPYRILGVYANSPMKDVVVNKGRATAFQKMNRSVDYPLDLKGIMPQLMRTPDSLNEAEAHLVVTYVYRYVSERD